MKLEVSRKVARKSEERRERDTRVRSSVLMLLADTISKLLEQVTGHNVP